MKPLNFLLISTNKIRFGITTFQSPLCIIIMMHSNIEFVCRGELVVRAWELHMSIHTHHMIVTTSLPTLLHYRQLLIEQLCQQADITIVGPTDHQAATALKGLGAKVVVLEWNNVSVNPWRFYRHQKRV